MAAYERNFATFELGDNPGQLGDWVGFDIADRVHVDLGDGSDPEAWGNLVGALGSDKVLRNNRELTDIWTPDEAAALVTVTGIQEPLDRSLWSPDIPTPDSATRIATGAVANWQDRTAVTLGEHVGEGSVWIPAGNRSMNGPTEIGNAEKGLPAHKSVTQFMASFERDEDRRPPTETEYAGTFVVPKLVKAGYRDIHLRGYETRQGEEVARSFVAEHPELFDASGEIAVARVANAGVQLATQMRAAGQWSNEHFDADPDKPQVYMLTDTLPVARTAFHLKHPDKYQSPYTALRQVAVTGKALAEFAISR